MSLATTIAAIFGRRYDKGAVMLSNDAVRNAIAATPCLAVASVFLKDGDYMGLEAGRLRDFLEDKVWTVGAKYRAEAFDCDDFAACARADVLRAGNAEGFQRAMFVAEVCHYPINGVYHDALLIADATGALWFYEPQTGALTKDVASKIKIAGEIWG